MTVQEGGRGATAVLAEALPTLVAALNFSKSMRWEPHSDLAFSRPVRWLLAMHGDVCVPFAVGSVRSAASTRLLRTSNPPTAAVASVSAYPGLLAGEGIILSMQRRRKEIWAAVQQAAEVRPAWPSSLTVAHPPVRCAPHPQNLPVSRHCRCSMLRLRAGGASNQHQTISCMHTSSRLAPTSPGSVPSGGGGSLAAPQLWLFRTGMPRWRMHGIA